MSYTELGLKGEGKGKKDLLSTKYGKCACLSSQGVCSQKLTEARKESVKVLKLSRIKPGTDSCTFHIPLMKTKIIWSEFYIYRNHGNTTITQKEGSHGLSYSQDRTAMEASALQPGLIDWIQPNPLTS